MKKILILPTNLDLNRGDQALVWEAARLIEDVYGKENVSYRIMASNLGEDAEVQKVQTRARGYSFVNLLLEHPGRNTKKHENDRNTYTISTLIQWGVQAVCDYLCTFWLLSSCKYMRSIGKLFLNQDQKAVLEAFQESDAIFVKGGGFIHSFGSITDMYFSYYLLFHIRLALALGKKVYILPNSVGPLNNPISKRMTIKTLRRCALVSVREKISLDFLTSLGVDAKYYPDFGFYLRSSQKDFTGYLVDHGVPMNQKKVVITLRPNRFTGMENAHQLYLNYLEGACRLVDYLVTRGYHVTFFAHTLGPSSHEDDRIAIKDVRNKLTPDVLCKTSYIEDFDLTCEDVEKIYSYYDYMVGTRFHSVIFSLNVGTPALAIAYGGNKGKGIMAVLDNSCYSIDMDKIIGDNLIKKFKMLESDIKSYVNNLKSKRLIIESMRYDCIDYIKESEGIK